MVNRTPPRPRRASPPASSHPSNEEQEQDDDEDMTPARPAALTPEEPTLRSVMEAVLAMRTELRDNQRQVQECQRQIQDLNALFIRTNSPLGRDNRAPSPTMRRSPQPEHQQQRERGPHPARMPRFDTSPPEDDIYGQLPSRSPQPEQQQQRERGPQPARMPRFDTAPPQDPYFGRGRTFSPPVLRRTSQNAPEDNRERQTSEFPAEIPPYRPSGDARIATAAPKTNIRPPTFAGRELENFSSWVWKMESYLRTIRVPPDDYFGTAMFYLVEEADAFVYDLVRRNNGKNLAWDTFKSEMRERYERPTIRSDLLRQKLENVRYEGPSQMIEYCTAFRAIEQQIFNMNFDDKLRTFLRPLPTNCQVYIKLSTTANDMEACYHIARQWAHAIEDTRSRKNGHGAKPSSSRTGMRQDRSRKRG